MVSVVEYCIKERSLDWEFDYVPVQLAFGEYGDLTIAVFCPYGIYCEDLAKIWKWDL